jgi:hypothetical protein
MVRPEPSTKLIGGITGDCPECERVWLATDGRPTGTRDRFTLSQKAAALVALSRGDTYRSAALEARRHVGYSRSWKTSRDGRLTGHWVSQHAPIIRTQILPSRWPYGALLFDDIPFSLRKVVGGKRVPSGVAARSRSRYAGSATASPAGALLRNSRLDDLLSLMAIQINGDADARTWARILP